MNNSAELADLATNVWIKMANRLKLVGHTSSSKLIEAHHNNKTEVHSSAYFINYNNGDDWDCQWSWSFECHWDAWDEFWHVLMRPSSHWEMALESIFVRMKLRSIVCVSEIERDTICPTNAIRELQNRNEFVFIPIRSYIDTR